MRQVRQVLVCLGIAASFAVVAANASAEAPEFGQCVKLRGGLYADKGCTQEAVGSGSFQWRPGPGPSDGFSESASGSKAFKWQLASNETGTCTGESATGDYTGLKTVGSVEIVLSGCSFQGACGTIALERMHGEIGVYEAGATGAQDKVGLKLTPEAGETLAELHCGTGLTLYRWRGGAVIVPLKTNKMLTKETLKYRAHHGPGFKEDTVPASFVGEMPDPLESTSNFGIGEEKPYAPIGWQTNPKLVNEEAIEVNTVL
jgi:hypothetical protein